MDFCESPPIFLVKDEADLSRNLAEVAWDPPIFHDNSLQSLTIMMAIDETQKMVTGADSKLVVPIGKTTKITYQALDQAGNVAHCGMDITVQCKQKKVEPLTISQEGL